MNGPILHQPEPEQPREIGPVDGSMTAADVKAALSMRWPDDRYLHVLRHLPGPAGRKDGES